MCSDYCTFRLAQLVIYMLIVYGLLRYFKGNTHDSGLLNPTSPLPVFHHRPSYAQKQSPCKLLSNVVIHMPCITTILQRVINWKWFSCVRAYSYTSDYNG